MLISDKIVYTFYIHYLQQFAKDAERLDKAYRSYIHRADITQTRNTNEIIVCHGNVISYFVLR